MKISDFRTGMVVVDDKGNKATVLLGTANGDIVAGETYFPLHCMFNVDGSINHKPYCVKVLQPCTNKEYGSRRGEVIWEHKEFTYPMWFKDRCGTVVKFTGLETGIVVAVGSSRYFEIGFKSAQWAPHTDHCTWEQIPEPCEEMTLSQICEALGKTIKIIND